MKKDKRGKISNIIKGIIIVILLFVLLVNVYVMIQVKTKPDDVPSIFGYKPFIVLSGSMETEIYIGDLVIIKEIDASELKVNDIIAFREADNLVTTHRIINIVEMNGDLYFETKGDNNNTKDEGLVSADSIEGKYHSKIPDIGNAILFIQQPLGFVVMMMTLFIICIFIYLFENRKIDKQMKIEDEEELKEFEEFKRAKEKARLEQQEREKINQ